MSATMDLRKAGTYTVFARLEDGQVRTVPGVEARHGRDAMNQVRVQLAEQGLTTTAMSARRHY